MANTKMTRRAALASLSTVAAIGAPTIASAMGGLETATTADPIFEAIAAYKQAVADRQAAMWLTWD
jgi:hypothetical protein